MAIKPCKECGNQVSGKALACPSCGAKQPKKTSIVTWFVLGLIGFTVLIGALGALMGGGETQEVEVKAEPKEENKAGMLLFMAQQQIKASAKDPSSVVFQGEQLHQKTKYGAVACGEVNGKNSFGGYTGMKGFVVTEKDGEILLEGSQNNKEFIKIWNEICAK